MERSQPAAAAASSLSLLLDSALASSSPVSWLRPLAGESTGNEQCGGASLNAGDTTRDGAATVDAALDDERSCDAGHGALLDDALRAVTAALQRHGVASHDTEFASLSWRLSAVRAEGTATAAAAVAADERANAAAARCERARCEWRRVHSQLEAEQSGAPLLTALTASKLSVISSNAARLPPPAAAAATPAEAQSLARRPSLTQCDAMAPCPPPEAETRLPPEPSAAASSDAFQQTPASLVPAPTPRVADAAGCGKQLRLAPRSTPGRAATPKMPTALHRRAARAAAAWDSD